MRKITAPIGQHLVKLIDDLRLRLYDPTFCARHRIRPQDFTRHRSLPFPVVLLLILQKTVKSVKRHLDDFLAQLAAESAAVTPGGWTQARAKLKHTAFSELNRECVLPAAYPRGPASAPRLWKGHRVLASDSSLVRLPNRPDIAHAFGVITVINQTGVTGTAYPEGRVSVLYDVLNRIGLDARLEPSTVGEVDLAYDHFTHFGKRDLTLVDRALPAMGYWLTLSRPTKTWWRAAPPVRFWPPRNCSGSTRPARVSACSCGRRRTNAPPCGPWGCPCRSWSAL